MNKAVLLIGVGGLIGSIARYMSSSYLTKILPASFPYGTFAVNMIGCLIIGIIYGLSERYEWFNTEWRLFLATGVCGGFTTFSSFAYENIKLLQSGEYLTFTLYSIGSMSIGLLACFGGILLTKI